MRRWIGMLLLAVLLTPAAHPVRAGVLWCKSDPVYSLNGTLVDVTVDIPLDAVLLVNGPIHYEIQTPPMIARTLILNDLGYNGHGVTTQFTDQTDGVLQGPAFLTTVTVTVPLDTSDLPPGTTVPARLTVFPLNGTLTVVEGTTDGTTFSLWITGQ